MTLDCIVTNGTKYLAHYDLGVFTDFEVNAWRMEEGEARRAADELTSEGGKPWYVKPVTD